MSQDELLKEVYQELRNVACHILSREKPGQTLQPTALVHEAYLKMRASYPQVLAGTDRRAFMACAAEAMRRIVVDQARRKKALKRGGNAKRLPLDGVEFALPRNEIDLEKLSEAITGLEAHDAAAAEVVKLKYFVGLKMPQIAEAMEQSLSTTNRQWRYAKAWLKDYLDSQRNADTK